jgi:hypothetical protein
MSGPTVIDPRQAVLLQLATAHTRLVDAERRLWKAGDTVQAEGAHRLAIAVLRAYTAEDRDPPPAARP